MALGLDHIVHTVRDLDAAAELYQSLGFTVGARNRHPWGTHNRLIQFNGTYIELLTVAEPDKIVPHAPHSFSFGAFHRDFLAREQGLAMMLLHSHDAKSDNVAWRGAGIGDFDVFNFEREGKRPDGSIVKLAFSLIFAGDQNADAGFGACQHYYPENFWNPAFQKHANGVARIKSVVLVADIPARHREFFTTYTGVGSERDSDGGFTLDLPNGAIEVMTPAAFRDEFGVSPNVSPSLRLAALRFAGAKAAEKHGTIGALLVFEPGR